MGHSMFASGKASSFVFLKNVSGPIPYDFQNIRIWEKWDFAHI